MWFRAAVGGGPAIWEKAAGAELSRARLVTLRSTRAPGHAVSRDFCPDPGEAHWVIELKHSGSRIPTALSIYRIGFLAA